MHEISTGCGRLGSQWIAELQPWRSEVNDTNLGDVGEIA
jgi:hypothetical protein